MMNGDDNFIEDFSMGYNSGEEYRINNIYCIRNPSFPLDVKVTYTSWNQIHTATHAVIFEFTINDQGAWDITLFN
jgi:FlaG/FlaF family flagellin (archaellin)